MTEIYKPLDSSPFFNYKTLTRIHGIPDDYSIKTLEDEVKANASSVQSSLRGGQYGHLGLVLLDTKYAHVSIIPCILQERHEDLDIPSGTAQHEVH